MRYEEMTAAPLKAFSDLVRFLGLPADMDRLKRAAQFSDFKELSRQEQSIRFVESRPDGKTKFFREGRSGRWRELFSPAQIDRLTEAHRPVLLELGYLAADGSIAA
jgi:hypothetical protein